MLSSNVRLNREQIVQLRKEILEGDWDDSSWEDIPDSTVNVTKVDAITTNSFDAAETDLDEFKSAGIDVRINIGLIVIAGRRFVRKIAQTKRCKSPASRRPVVTRFFGISLRFHQRSSSFVNVSIWRWGEEKFCCQRFINAYHSQTSALLSLWYRWFQLLPYGDYGSFERYRNFMEYLGFIPGIPTWT